MLRSLLLRQKILLLSRCTFSSSTAQSTSTSSALARYVADKESPLIEKLFRGKHRVRHASTLKKGETLSNFIVKDIQELKEFGITAFTLEHSTTHARYVHLDTGDMNNCFAIVLHTPPIDDKGLPLLTQRLVMCGSENYPIKEALSHMSELRSMNSNSEAWTGPEFTVFPFATTNEKDFYNLLGIHLESIFKPLNRRVDFLYEGVRLELPNDDGHEEPSKKIPLSLEGVTYTETFNNAQIHDQIFLSSIQSKIYAGSHYQHLGSGHHKALRKATYNDVIEYYNKYYKTNNVSFFSYGDLDFKQHLEYIDGVVMRGMVLPPIIEDTSVPTPMEYVKENILKCPPSPDGSPIGSAAMTFLCNDIIADPFETLAMSVLSYCLFELPQSVFFTHFLNTGAAKQYCPGYGYDVTNRIATFTVGFAHISNEENELQETCDRIMRTLADIAHTGLDKETVEFALHYMEVNARESKADLGMSLLQNMIPFIIHQADPTVLLRMEQSFSRLRKEIEEGLLERLIQKYFLENKHGLRTIVKPDFLLSDAMRREEKEYLKGVQESLTPQDILAIKQETQTVMQETYKLQDVSILPSLRIDQIVPLVESFEHEVIDVSGLEVWMTEQETNGLSYVRVKFDITDIDPTLMHFIELFCIVFPHIGCSSHSTNRADFIIDNYTSRFDMEPHVFRDVNNADSVKKILVFTLGYIDRNIEKTFGLLTDLLSSPDFSNLSRISELLQYYSGVYANNLAEKPMEMAIAHASSGLSKACFLNDKMKRTQDVCSLAMKVLNTTALKPELENIAAHLQAIYHQMINQNRIKILAHTQKKSQKQLIKRIELLAATVKFANPHFTKPLSGATAGSDLHVGKFMESYKRSIVALPINTNYIVESFKMPEILSAVTPVMHLAGEIMKNSIHFEEVRSVEGVYDAGCFLDVNGGAFSMYSFRDSHTISRYQTFEKAIQYITMKDFSERDLKEAKMSLFSRIDRNIEPYNKGLKWFLFGMHDRVRLNYRQAILATTSQKVIDTTAEILVESIKKSQSSQIIFGQQQHNLKRLLSKGWQIEKALDGLSVSEKSYKQNESEKFAFNEGI